MAHKKMRNDTSIAVYKYGAQPLQVLPDDLWNYAKLTQNVWNDLVGIRQFLSGFFDEIKLPAMSIKSSAFITGKSSIKLGDVI